MQALSSYRDDEILIWWKSQNLFSGDMIIGVTWFLSDGLCIKVTDSLYKERNT